MTERITLYVLLYNNGLVKLYVGSGTNGVNSVFSAKEALKFGSQESALLHLARNPHLKVAEFVPVPEEFEFEVDCPAYKHFKEEANV